MPPKTMSCLIVLVPDGRRPIYLASLPCLCIGSLGVASSHSVPTLMAWRVFQAFGTSSGISVGAGVIGDIYKVEERGAAIGMFFAVSMCAHGHKMGALLTGELAAGKSLGCRIGSSSRRNSHSLCIMARHAICAVRCRTDGADLGRGTFARDKPSGSERHGQAIRRR